MKKFKLGSRILSCVLAFSMILGTCTTVFAAAPEGSSGGEIKYVSLGDSMTNGYGLEGYNGNNGVFDYGYSYANLFADWLVEVGYASEVEHAQLAMSGCRAEDYHWFLELDHEDPEIRAFLNDISNDWEWNEEEWFEKFKIGDYRTWGDMCSDGNRSSAAASNILGYLDYDSPYATEAQKEAVQEQFNDEELSDEVRYVHYTNDNQAAIVAEYMQNVIKHADIISMSVGNSNFGTFMFDQIINATGYKGNTPSKAMKFNIERTLEELPVELQTKVLDLKDKLYAKIEEKLDIELDYEEGADYIDGKINPDNMTAAIANAAVYAGISYVLNYAGTVDAILKLNQDVEIILLGLMNTYLSTNENEDEATIGSLLEVIFPPLNAFIAGLPTVMQGIKSDIYKDATFYYAEAPEVACMVEVYGNDFYKDHNDSTKFVDYDDENKCNVYGNKIVNRGSITRQRFFRDLLGTIAGFFQAGETSISINSNLTFEELCAYDAMNDTQKAEYAYNTTTTDDNPANDSNAITCAVYLAFEDATIRSGRVAPVTLSSLSGLGNMSPTAFAGVITEYYNNLNARKTIDEETSLNAIANIFNAAAQSRFGLYSDVTADELRAVYEANDADKFAIAQAIMTRIANLAENEAFIAAQTEDNLESACEDNYPDFAEAFSIPFSWEQFKMYGGDNYIAFVNNVRVGVRDGVIAYIVSAGAPIILDSVASVDALCRLLGTPYALGDAMAEDAVAISWFGLLGRCVIGDGLGGHPAPAGHDALFEAVKSSYEDGYTAKDETLANLKEFAEIAKGYILEYYDEAYALAYAEADKAGYVDKAAKAIDNAINVIMTLDLSDVEMTDEMRAKLTEECAALIATLEEIKVALIEDKASDVEGLYNVAVELWDDLNTHLTLASAILAQAEFDIRTLLCPVIDAYVKTIIEEYVIPFVDEIKGDLSDIELKKVDHKHYEPTEDSYYVAIGGDTVMGQNIPRGENPYQNLISEEYGIDYNKIAKIQLLSSEVLPLIEENAEEIKKADLITYQLDATNFIWSTLSVDADWDKYINEYLEPEERELVEKIVDETIRVLTMDWKTHADTKIAELVEKIKAAVLSKLPEDVPFVENIFDALVDFLLPYIQDEIIKAEEKVNDRFELDEKIDIIEGINNKITSLDETTKEYIEKFAFAFVAYAIETSKAVEAIEVINPDATLVVVGMYNPLRGLEIKLGDAVINAEEYFEYVIKATNHYYSLLSMTNKEFAFVDVAEAETDGFNITIDVANMEDISGTLISMALRLPSMMNANAAGHEYIKDQIVKALTCVYDKYVAVDENNHAVMCSICDYVLKNEEHVGDPCSKCGYTKPVVPEDPEDPDDPTPGRPVVGGGGAASNQFTVKFETNGGSTVASVTVKKDELLAEPAAPTKEGFVFDGWYTDKALTEKYDFSTPVTKAFTLYAKWTAASAADKFTDLDKAAWYYEYVKAIIEEGLMNGVSETSFAPNATLTRGMFVTILHRVEGEPVTENGANFMDVAEGQYYADAVKWANANGIVKGITETEFAPNAEVTREQMAAMLARYADYKELAVAEGDVTYTDSDEISEYAKDAVKTANKLGILIGNADGSFAPKKDATRAEAAALFVRLLGVLEK